MKILFTGQPGLNKKPYIEKIVKACTQHNKKVKIFHIGELIYKKESSVLPGRILNLPRKQQFLLTENIYQYILNKSKSLKKDIFINGHATFRWSHGLYHTLDFKTLKKISPNIVITLVSDVDIVRFNLNKRIKKYHYPRFTLKDIIVWREEEIMTSELLSVLLKAKYYIIPMAHSPEMIYKLIYENKLRKVYVSFPMSHVRDKPKLLAEINRFRKSVRTLFVVFDPSTIEEKRLLYFIEDITSKEGSITIRVGKKKMRLNVKEIQEISEDIDGQIISRDYKMIEQSDLIIAYIPELLGKPVISEGVEREIQHAYDCAKEVYVIWTAKKENPSPFLKKTTTEIFTSLAEALDYFRKSKK